MTLHSSHDARALMSFQTHKKSTLLTYVLWFFLGALGLHRFYLGKWGSGLMQLLLSVIGGATAWLGVGFLLLIPLGIWLFLDIFLIPGMVRRLNERLMERLIDDRDRAEGVIVR